MSSAVAIEREATLGFIGLDPRYCFLESGITVHGLRTCKCMLNLRISNRKLEVDARIDIDHAHRSEQPIVSANRAARGMSCLFVWWYFRSAALILQQSLFYKPSSIDDHASLRSSGSASRRGGSSAPSQLAQLRADENLIALRKFNVTRFGAGWLRPPGVTKTLQSRLEEAQEQLEQLELQRRDAEMRAQEEAAQNAAGAGHGFDEFPDQEERDLDAEVPDADPSTITTDDELENNTIGMTFHEESILQGSPMGGGRHGPLELEDAELNGRLQDERDMGMEGDLDDDVPEAGSYEHTDTELEDDSSDESDLGRQSPLSQPRSSARSNAQFRMSLRSDDSAMLGSSSFIDDSPAVLRRSNNANARVRPRPS